MLVQSSTSSSALAALTSVTRSASEGHDKSGTRAATGSGMASGTSRYDFSNMTPAQMRDAVNRMIRGGELSLDETSSLLCIMAPPSARLKVDGTTGARG